MDWYWHTDIFSSVCERDKRLRRVDPLDFYAAQLKRCTAESRPILRAEQDWRGFGQPYFKVWPSMALAFSNTEIDIPSAALRLPYPAFAILFPRRGDNPFEPRPVRSLLVHEREEQARILSLIAVVEQDDGEQDVLCMTTDMTADTIEECFSWMRSKKTSGIGAKTREALQRIAVCTAFFGIDQHELVAPDITRREVYAVARANVRGDRSRIEKIMRKAGERLGFKIGQEIELPLPHVNILHRGRPEDERPERSYAHMRRGHMRWQAHGERHSQRKLIFIAPTMVRHDLPLSSSQGYKITDQ